MGEQKKQKKLGPRAIAERIVEAYEQKGRRLVTYDGEVYVYTGSHYTIHNGLWKDIMFLSEKYGTDNGRNWDDIHRALRQQTLRTEPPDTGYVPFLDFRVPIDGEDSDPVPHSPDYFNTYVLPYNYGEWGPADRFYQFLDEATGGDPDLKALLQEVAGYILMPGLSMDKAFVFYGLEGTGKSVMIEVLEAMVGYDNVSHVPLERFGDKFALAGTEGKLLNTATEIGKTSRSIDGVFKSFVSGEMMPKEKKYKDVQSFRPTAKLVFGSNIMPNFNHLSGLSRRLVFIPFNNTPKVIDPYLIDKLKEEIGGVFDWAYQGMQRLLARGEFTAYKGSMLMHQDFQINTSSVFAFLDDHEHETDPTSVILFSDFYEAYVLWCKENGRSKVSAQRFRAELQTALRASVRTARVKKRGPLRDKTVVAGVSFPTLDIALEGSELIDALETLQQLN